MRSRMQRGELASWVLGAGLALLAAATSLLSLPAQAQVFTLQPAEKVPTFLGIDLPLRPGERLLPLGKSGCSMVVFEPKPEQYEAYRKLWGEYEWSGACRFGLIHGNGQISLPGNSYGQEIWGIYGTWYRPERDAALPVAYFYSGSAFSSLDAKQVALANGDPESFDRFEKTSGNSFGIGLQSFDASGNALSVGVLGDNFGYACRPGAKDDYKPFESEVKKACSRKEGAQAFVSRSEGTSGINSGKYVWLKTCPLKKGSGEADCPALMRDAIGKHYAELETIIASSPAARQVMIQEILNRYAPLEAAFEARLKEAASGRGAQ